MATSTRTRRALITGGSSGIGLAAGRMLVQRGYEVVLNDRREGPLAEDAASFKHRTPECAEENPTLCHKLP
jgi:NAD(P)-dependent dehydrogenase (short-subunit alcohol dehydrogenase family)